MKNIRQVFKYKPQRCYMKDLKPGDIFSMNPASSTDDWDPSQLYIVSKNGSPKRQKNRPRGYWEVKGRRLEIK